MNSCPYCQAEENQIKAGKNDSGSQRYICKACGRRYTPQPSQMYGEELHRQAVRLYVDGMSFRRIARHLQVDHVTVMHWICAYTDQLSPAPVPSEQPLHIVEMDELYTFIEHKKSGSI